MPRVMRKMYHEVQTAPFAPGAEAPYHADSAGRFPHRSTTNCPLKECEPEHRDLRGSFRRFALQTAAEQSEEVLESFKRAFSGFSDEKISILDGVILETASR